MSMASPRRFLHFVFKIGNRKDSINFYCNVLGMKVLRHEEFEEGCKATCNGPFDGKWSKTMVGYGPEINHFVVELTYNYGIKSYKRGNDFLGLVVISKSVLEQVKQNNWPVKEESGFTVAEAPGGYRFLLQDASTDEGSDPVKQVILASSNLQKSVEYWNGILGMKIYEKQEGSVVLGYGENQCTLRLKDIGTSVKHEEAYGRIAFACPTAELPDIQAKVKNAGQTILTPLVTLDTPGKADVQVVILADPDGHEICFVGDEAFQELSQVDPKAEELLNVAMDADFSDEWFAQKSK